MEYDKYKAKLAKQGLTIEDRLRKNSDKMRRDRKRLNKFRGDQARWVRERKKELRKFRGLKKISSYPKIL